ncbi:unnamed protein product [Durusdinium trenchii]|uniref:Uncharacterized protein n=1 Tax=Durusdinium trenchii TaxID=1381693 RepID=A0ABP0JKG2_9DINO
MMAQGQRSPPLAAKRRSGPVQAVHSPPSQSRVPRGATASPLNSPPVGGATTSVRVFQDHIPNARSAGSLVGNVPPLDRRRKEGGENCQTSATLGGKTTPRMPKKTPRMASPRSSWANGAGPCGKVLTDEEEKRRRRPAEVPPVDLKLRRSASGSLMEGVSDSRANASGAYPVVKPPLSATRSGAESATTGTFTSFSGSTTPLTEGGEGVPSTLLSRLRNNPVLQVQDSRIMQLIGKRSVLKTGQAGRSKARSTPSDDKEELDTEEVVETVETTPFAPGDRPRKRASHAAGASQAPPGVDPQEELQRKVTNHDSPRNCVADHVAVMDDSADSAIVWPGMPKEEERLEPEPREQPSEQPSAGRTPPDKAESMELESLPVEVPVQTPPAAVASVAPAPAQPAPEHAARIPTPHVLLQNEAGSLVVPQTWRFVLPPPEQAPKPAYEKPREAEAMAAMATPIPSPRETSGSRQEALTPRDLIEELVQDQVKLDLRDKQQLVEQLVECLIDQVKRYEKELGAEQRAKRALKMSLEVEQRKAMMYHQRLTQMAHQMSNLDKLEVEAEPEATVATVATV